ncbi:hypothetical protein MNBD_GAMMA12-2473 [hydrothermal vent metagenome]|uniref:Uncharacterized protein n=1 Tax=hydrothermal vent metagenome TaxID=652676 RepID=A0A3B0Y8D1_9ZZZZ
MNQDKKSATDHFILTGAAVIDKDTFIFTA